MHFYAYKVNELGVLYVTDFDLCIFFTHHLLSYICHQIWLLSGLKFYFIVLLYTFYSNETEMLYIATIFNFQPPHWVYILNKFKE